jgi:hypothetical protein
MKLDTSKPAASSIVGNLNLDVDWPASIAIDSQKNIVVAGTNNFAAQNHDVSLGKKDNSNRQSYLLQSACSYRTGVGDQAHIERRRRGGRDKRCRRRASNQEFWVGNWK